MATLSFKKKKKKKKVEFAVQMVKKLLGSLSSWVYMKVSEKDK